MRRAGYDRDGEEISEADVLSDEEMAEDHARRRRHEGGRHSFKVPERPRLRSGHAAYDDPRVEEFWPDQERRQDR